MADAQRVVAEAIDARAASQRHELCGAIAHLDLVRG